MIRRNAFGDPWKSRELFFSRKDPRSQKHGIHDLQSYPSHTREVPWVHHNPLTVAHLLGVSSRPRQALGHGKQDRPIAPRENALLPQFDGSADFCCSLPAGHRTGIFQISSNPLGY